MGRIIIIGDVHGCSEELSELIQEIRPEPQDRFIFLGDLVNRGPDSHGVLAMVRQLPNARVLLGNHELRLLRYYESKNEKDLKNGDHHTKETLTSEDWEYMKTFEGPIFLEEHNTLLVHGGFLPTMPWQKQSIDITTQIQVISADGKAYKRKDCPEGTPWQDLWDKAPFVIYGHWPKSRIEKRTWSLGIDTGCVSGGHLTACILPGREIYQVKAKQPYNRSYPLNNP